MATERITESTVLDFCMMRLANDSPQYVELRDEFLRDPTNSRVGLFSQEGERIMAIAAESELDWEGLLLAWEEAEAAIDQSVEPESNPVEAKTEAIRPIWAIGTRIAFWFCTLLALSDGILNGIDAYWTKLPGTLENLASNIERAMTIQQISASLALFFGTIVVAIDCRNFRRSSSIQGGAMDGVVGWLCGALLGVVIGLGFSLFESSDEPSDGWIWAIASITGFIGSIIGMRSGRAIRRWFAGRELTIGELAVFAFVAITPMLPSYVRAVMKMQADATLGYVVLGISAGFGVRIFVSGKLSTLRQFQCKRALVFSLCSLAVGTIAAMSAFYFGGAGPQRLDVAILYGQIAMSIPASIPIAESFAAVWRSLDTTLKSHGKRQPFRWRHGMRFLWIGLFAVPVAIGTGVGFTDLAAGFVEKAKRKSTPE